ncbi:MAG: murein L,D-transpeptidase catalytic domain family protein [Pseudoxanthomonas sp.]
MSRLLIPMALALAVAAPFGSAHAPARSTAAATRAVASSVDASPRDEAASLSRLAPIANPEVLALALSAMQCAQRHGTGTDATRLAVIDYTRSSLQPRLWVFDLASHRLLYQEVVAHGQGSGEDVPTRFSNSDGSHQSSLGLFYTGDTYQGRNGYSMRMQGLEAGVNDAAMARAIVMHGADYVDPDNGRRMGRLGRSWGCPALRSAVARPLIDVMKNGQFVFSYYPDQAWLARSALLKCSGPASANAPADRAARSH